MAWGENDPEVGWGARDPQAGAAPPKNAPRKSNPLRDVNAFLTTAFREVPFLDELTAAKDTAIGVVEAAATGGPVSLDRIGKRYRNELKAQRDEAGAFRQRHPVLAGQAKGLGMGATIFVPGGKAAQYIAAAPKLSSAAARGALVGGTYGAVTGAGNADGGLDERVSAAAGGAALGAIGGAALPAAAAAVRGGARVANALSGGRVLDAEEQAMMRLRDALAKDGLDPDAIRTAVAEWQRTGASSPTLMDIARKSPKGGQHTMRLISASASKGDGANLATKHLDRVAADLQDNAIARTRALTPDRRTVPAIERSIDNRITAASQIDEATPGSGGRAVSGALNQAYETRLANVNNLYDRARQIGADAHVPAAERPTIVAGIRESVRDFDPVNIAGVGRELDRLDKLGTVTVRDLFEARQRLGTFRIGQTPEAVAAGRAVRAIDAQIDDLAARNVITGDPAGVSAWREAIGARRQLGQDFEGDDLIADLVERGRHGAGRANMVAAEDASNAILGRSGVAAGPDMLRDLTRMRDMLGEDSPAWNALRQEARLRLLGRDAGTERFGAAWDRFARQNPEMAALLQTPDEARLLAEARSGVGAAVDERAALETGGRILNAMPDDYADEIAQLGSRVPLPTTAQVGAAREIEGAIGRVAEGGTATLNKLATGTNATRNLAETFGPEEGARYQAAIQNEIDKLLNARFVSPNTNSASFRRIEEQGLVDIPELSARGILRAILLKLRAGATLTDAEKAVLVKMGISDAGSVAPRLIGPPSNAPRLAPVVTPAIGVSAGNAVTP